VEDHPIEQRLIQLLARQFDLHIDVVNNGSEALERLTNQRYSLVLMDWSLPGMSGDGIVGDGMNGLECTKRIRELEKNTNHHIPIIAVTAHAMRDDKIKCLDAGMDDYLSKPFSCEQFFSKIQKWLNVSKSVKTAS
jgi:CheY-like chemotaxis protein